MFCNPFGKIIALAALVLVAWSVAASPSGAHGRRTLYRVRPDDTLWTIAASHYAGDPGAAVWQIEAANHLGNAPLYPGETLVLP